MAGYPKATGSYPGGGGNGGMGAPPSYDQSQLRDRCHFGKKMIFLRLFRQTCRVIDFVVAKKKDFVFAEVVSFLHLRIEQRSLLAFKMVRQS